MLADVPVPAWPSTWPDVSNGWVCTGACQNAKNLASFVYLGVTRIGLDLLAVAAPFLIGLAVAGLVLRWVGVQVGVLGGFAAFRGGMAEDWDDWAEDEYRRAGTRRHGGDKNPYR